MKTPTDPGCSLAKPGSILEHLGIDAWFAGRDKTLVYVNALSRRTRADITAALGKNVEDCHKRLESREEIRVLYGQWEAGSTEVRLSSREVEGGKKYNILIPVQGPDEFEGCLELAFTVKD
jgi:hypothetical protein